MRVVSILAVLALCACDPQAVADQAMQRTAASVVKPVLAQNLPGPVASSGAVASKARDFKKVLQTEFQSEAGERARGCPKNRRNQGAFRCRVARHPAASSPAPPVDGGLH